MSDTTPIKLRVPRQDLAEFSLFPLSPEGAQQWTQSLPVANTRMVVAQLREAVRDLNRVEMAVDLRLEIMELLSPSLQVALTNLSRRFLNQPLVLPEEPRQLAELAENLYSLFSTAYTLVAVHAIQRHSELDDINPARLTCIGLQRALHFAGRRMLQTFLLYQNVETHGWLTLHQLYAVGERQKLSRLPVRDQQGQQVTLQSTYLRALLLGCCKANQLRQSDLTGIYTGLQEWSTRVRLLEEDAASEGLFAVDMNADHPPMYSSTRTSHSPQHRYIDTSDLVEHLETLRDQDRANGRQGVRLARDLTLPSNILDHLIASLGSHSLRNFSRAGDSDTELEVAVGLSSVHYHAAGGVAFSELLPRQLNAGGHLGDNPFARRQSGRDHWHNSEPDDLQRGVADAHSHSDPGDCPPQVDGATAARREHTENAQQEPRQRFPVFAAIAVNSSPGGYCLEWSDSAPLNLRSGDLMCVREPGQRDWVIAAVRWVSALEQANTLVGVELLSPRAMPYGARMIRQRGAPSDPMRVLLLPEIKLVGKPHTLITARTGFRERQKLVLFRDGEEFLIQLQRQIGATASFSQFDFRYIKELEQISSAVAEEIELPRAAFESLWSDI